MSNRQGISRQGSPGFVVLVAVLAAGVLSLALPASGLGAGGCKGAPKAPAKLSTGQLRRAALCLINSMRHRHGLGSLHLDRALRKAATRHSNDMVRRDYFSHYSPGGGSMQSRIGNAGYLAGARSFQVGEVIGGGTSNGGSPKSVMQAWMHSGGHRAAILSGSFHDLGIGVAHGFPGRGKRGATFTVDFGSRSG